MSVACPTQTVPAAARCAAGCKVRPRHRFRRSEARGEKTPAERAREASRLEKQGRRHRKSGSFSCFLPHFSAKIPLFSPAMRRQKTLARSGGEIGAEKTSRPTEPTHDLREQTERCPPPKARWRASKRIARVFSPDRNTAPSEKVAQRGLKVPLWACAREKNARSRARVERNAYICTSYMAPIRHPAHPLPNR